MNSTTYLAPLISFVITTNNHSTDYLLECIKSILQLSLNHKEREIILIDDASEESPIKGLTEYLESIIYLRLPNMGESTARNYGILMAKGNYIQFIDGDDFLIQAAYEHCLDIVRYHQPDIVTFNFTQNNYSELSYELPTPISGTEYLNSHNLQSSVCSYIFRRNIIGSLQFSTKLTYAEDEEFTPQLFLRAERIFKTNTSPYYNRVDKYNTNLLNDKETQSLHQDNKLKVILNLQKLLDTIPIAERQAINRRIAQLTMDYLCDCIRINHSLLALNHEIKLLKKYGLYPLPNKEYSKRYVAFCKLIKYQVGRIVLCFLIKKDKS